MRMAPASHRRLLPLAPHRPAQIVGLARYYRNCLNTFFARLLIASVDSPLRLSLIEISLTRPLSDQSDEESALLTILPEFKSMRAKLTHSG